MSHTLEAPRSLDSKVLAWTDPHGLIAAKARVFLYFVRVVDDAGAEYRYIGKTKDGRIRLAHYQRAVERIFAGLPRRVTRGQEKYRAVQFAIAKACKHGWSYDFYPLEAVTLHQLGEVEQQRIRELQCSLNGARMWRVEEFENLTFRELLGP